MAGDGSDAFEDDAEPTVTIGEYIEGIEAEELEADLVLGGDDGKECTYGGGYLKRQAVFSCLTCVPAGAAGVCTACSLACHDGHEVTEGVSEFKPTPPENREFCKNSYSVPNTLLVKFSIDAIDDTDIVEDILRPRVDSIGGQIKKVILSGTHLTPCVQDVKWQVGSEYTPADALAQGLKSLALNETRVLSRTIADWFRSLIF